MKKTDWVSGAVGVMALVLTFAPIVDGKREPDIAHEQKDARSPMIELTQPGSRATANTDTTCLPSYHFSIGDWTKK